MKEKLPLRKCKQCHRQFQPTKSINVFCTKRCNNIFNGHVGSTFSMTQNVYREVDLRGIKL